MGSAFFRQENSAQVLGEGEKNKELIRGRELRAREQEGLFTKWVPGRQQDLRAGTVVVASMQTKPRPPRRDLETQHEVSIAYVMPELEGAIKRKPGRSLRQPVMNRCPQTRQTPLLALQPSRI